MAKVTLRERILRRAKAKLEAVTPSYPTVERWDSRTLSDEHRAVTVYPGRETVSVDSINGEDEDEIEFLIHPVIVLAQDEDDSNKTGALMNDEIGRMVEALCDTSDRTWVEPAGNQEALILSCLYDGAEEPVQVGQSTAYEVEVRFRVTYHQLTGDPYQGGPATTFTE